MQYAGCDKQFRTVLADPPWPGQSSGTQYPVMSLEQIRRLPVARLVGADAHLWLWTRRMACSGRLMGWRRRGGSRCAHR